jgi:hypothetical protein
MAKLKIKHKQSNVYSGPSQQYPGGYGYGGGTAQAANVVVDASYPTATQVANIGVVGGANGLGLPVGVSVANVIFCIANICYDGNVSNAVAGDAFIVRQKGKSKFLVANVATPSQQQVCLLSNVADGNTANLPAATANLGTMAITAVDASSTQIAVFSITDNRIEGFAPDYVNANNIGNMSAANAYLASFAAANATIQPGSTLPVALISSQT